MAFETREVEDVTVVSPANRRLDAVLAPKLKELVAELVADGNNKIVLDVSNVEFMDSSGLGAAVAALKIVGGPGDMAICGASGLVADLFKLTHMDRVFTMAANEEEAVVKLAS